MDETKEEAATPIPLSLIMPGDEFYTTDRRLSIFKHGIVSHIDDALTASDVRKNHAHGARTWEAAIKNQKPYITPWPLKMLSVSEKEGPDSPQTAFMTFSTDPGPMNDVLRLDKLQGNAPIVLSLTSSQLRDSSNAFESVSSSSDYPLVPLQIDVVGYGNRKIPIAFSVQLMTGNRKWFPSSNSTAVHSAAADKCSSVVMLPDTCSQAYQSGYVANFFRTNDADFLRWMSIPSFSDIDDQLKKADKGDGYYEVEFPPKEATIFKHPLQWLVAARGCQMGAEVEDDTLHVVVPKEALDAEIVAIKEHADPAVFGMSIAKGMKLLLTPLNPGGWHAVKSLSDRTHHARSDAELNPVTSISVVLMMKFIRRKSEKRVLSK